jgi:hypothetical protein
MKQAYPSLSACGLWHRCYWRATPDYDGTTRDSATGVADAFVVLVELILELAFVDVSASGVLVVESHRFLSLLEHVRYRGLLGRLLRLARRLGPLGHLGLIGLVLRRLSLCFRLGLIGLTLLLGLIGLTLGRLSLRLGLFVGLPNLRFRFGLVILLLIRSGLVRGLLR